MERTDLIRHCIVLRRTENDAAMEPGRDIWWHDLVEGQAAECPPEAMNAEDLLYILYTSGTTAKPKGIMHTTGGYLVGAAATHSYVFDIKPDRDIWWCAADIGWVTGHTYIVYGPLANRTTSVMYEGTPDHPDLDRLWSIAAKYGVTQLYTAPTAIRAFMKWGEQYPQRHDLSSLRLLGTVGEPINPEAWMWYQEHIGGGTAPVVDTWWQTETGSIMISPLPGITATKPGSATTPMPGIEADVVDEQGAPVPGGGGGYLVIRNPWPSMLRSIWGDDQRYVDTYWSRFEGPLLPGGRRQAGRGRLPVAAGPGGRRDAGVGPQHLDHGGRVGPGLPSVGGGGGGGGPERPPHRPGHSRLREPAGRFRGRR